MHNLLTKTKAELEEIIQEGIDSFYAVGSALITIRDRKLYLDEYDNFEQYCQQKWNISRSMGYHLIHASVVVDSIGELPDRASHVQPLYKIKSDDLRQQAWAEIKATGVNITGQIVQNFAQKYQLFESEHWLAEPVKLNQITAEKAIALKNILASLPDYYENAVRTHGLVEMPILKALRTLEYEFDTEAKDILRSGWLNDKKWVDLNTTDIENYLKRLRWEAKQTQILLASEKQNNLISKTNMLVVNGSQIFEKVDTNRTVIYAFPDEQYSLKDLQSFLDRTGKKVMFVALYDADANINWDGEARPASSVNGVKPNLFTNFFARSVP